MKNTVIEVKNLKRYFKQYKKEAGVKGTIKSLFKRESFEIKAVDDISFKINKGEKVGFIGPNGAGKTTTLKMLSGILYPSSGEINVLGYKPFDRRKEFLKKIGLVLGQRSQLWWDLPAMEGFILNKEIYEMSDKVFKEQINFLSEMLDAKDILDIPVRKLSLGQRMKCELLAALLHKPEIVFLDEPTIGLDIIVQKRIREFFLELNEKHENTILLTSHYMDDVQELCNRLIIINNGKLIYDGPIDSLIKEHASHKNLKFIFNKKVLKNDLKIYGDVIEYDKDGFSATISVERKDHAKIAGDILSKLPVDDLDVSEVNLEDIIGNIFRN